MSRQLQLEVGSPDPRRVQAAFHREQKGRIGQILRRDGSYNQEKMDIVENLRT